MSIKPPPAAKSVKNPPLCKDLSNFENDLYNLAQSVRFRRVSNPLQDKLAKDLQTIHASPDLFVSADKTTNLYKVNTDDYNKLLHDNISAKYRKSNDNTQREINLEAKAIAKHLELDDKIEKLPEQHAFLSLKDHKPNFQSNPKCRLINPSKSNLGKVGKQLLDNIYSTVRKSTKFQQWSSTSAVITWFNNLPNKQRCKFLTFDVVDFYPSISEKLLFNSINYAKQFTVIDDHTINIIFHCRKSLLFSSDGTWIKKDGSLFDVTMGSFDGAEICELVGLFMLHNLANVVGAHNIGLNRDDGLAGLKDASGPTAERTRKKIIKIFQEHGLKIIADTNLVETNFLDVTLNLKSGKYWPFRKPNNSPLYVHNQSNHPPMIKKQLPIMLAKRLSNLLCNHEEFAKAIPEYEEAMRRSGHKSEIKYETNSHPNKRRSRKRDIIWFNPPYSEHVYTNIGGEFRRLLTKNFPPTHRLHKICNNNNVKLSYSCMPNMANLISKHNKTVLKRKANSSNTTPPCNCRVKTSCPLKRKCREKCIIYKATLTSDDSTMHYRGSCETDFKAHFYNHNQSFKYQRKSNATELSKAFWFHKSNGKSPEITWEIVTQTTPYQPGARACMLCLTEKCAILQANPATSLNKRTELMGKCRHTNEFKFKNIL